MWYLFSCSQESRIWNNLRLKSSISETRRLILGTSRRSGLISCAFAIASIGSLESLGFSTWLHSWKIILICLQAEAVYSRRTLFIRIPEKKLTTNPKLMQVLRSWKIFQTMRKRKRGIWFSLSSNPCYSSLHKRQTSGDFAIRFCRQTCQIWLNSLTKMPCLNSCTLRYTTSSMNKRWLKSTTNLSLPLLLFRSLMKTWCKERKKGSKQ